MFIFPFFSISRRLRRSASNKTVIQASLSSFGEKFTFKLKRSNVLHRSAKVVIRHEDDVQEWLQADPDCFLYGEVTSHHGSASLHFCDGLVSIYMLSVLAFHSFHNLT